MDRVDHQNHQLTEELRHAFKKHEEDDVEKKSLLSNLDSTEKQEHERLQEVKVLKKIRNSGT